jgi:hypothetical protein
MFVARKSSPLKLGAPESEKMRGPKDEIQDSGRKTLPSRLRTDSPLSLRVTAEWLEALDDWRAKQPVKPSRTAVIIAAVELFISSQKAEGTAQK